MRFPILSIIFLIVLSAAVYGQDREYHVLQRKIVGNDTIPYVKISGVEIYDFKIFKNKRLAKRNNKLIRNVKKVYPWAKLAGQKLIEYEAILASVETDKEKRRIMKQVEKEIQEEYGVELKKLTIIQGKILINLIDRETGDTSYELVQDFRGNFVAFFYQSFARIFGYNLKNRYDPEDEDRNIEIIVRMIESGMI